MIDSRQHALPTLKAAGLAALEAAINTALKFDRASRDQLAAMAGAVFHLECTSPDVDIYLLPHADGVQLAAHWEGHITAGLTGTRADYLELLRSQDPAATLINGNMRVIGDSKSLLRLRDIAAALDIDWEAALTRGFGDVIGHQLARSLRFGARLLRDAANSLSRQTRDYMREENPWLMRRAELETFQHHVADLHARALALQLRTGQLQQRIAAQMNSQQR